MTNKSLGQHIKVSDFEKLVHSVLFRNDTSGTSIVNPKSIKIHELAEKSISINMPANSCVSGHNVTLFIFQGLMKEKIKHIPQNGKLKNCFEIVGKVREVTHLEDRNDVNVDIHFSQYDIRGWKKISDQYEKQQEKINQLFLQKSQS
jgi:hypothetical protein